MKLYVTVVLVLMASILFGQTMWDKELAITNVGGLVWDESSILTEENEIIHVWTESAYEVSKVVSKKVDNEGNSLWGQEPIIIAESDNNHYNVKITRTNDGSYVVFWNEDGESDQHIVRAQKIDASGNRLWSNNGVFVFTQNNDFSPYQHQIFTNDIGGAIISWIDTENKIQSLDSNGLLQMNVDGLNIGSSSNNYQIISDGYGGLFVTNIEQDSSIIAAKRINSTGEIIWNQNYEFEYEFENELSLSVIYNSIDSYYLMMKDVSNSSPRLAVRKLSLTGELGTSVAYIPWTYPPYDFAEMDYITDANGNLFISKTQSYSLDPYSPNCIYSLSVYNLDQEFNHVWDESGVSLCPSFVADDVKNKIEVSDSGELFVLTYDTVMNLYKVNNEGFLETNESDTQLLLNELDFYSVFLGYEDDLFITGVNFSDGYDHLSQFVLDDNLQNLQSEDIVTIRRLKKGYIGRNDCYSLPDSENTVVIWLDMWQGANSKIMYQIINSDGSLVYEENGVEVADFSLQGEPYNGYEYSPTIFCSAQNDAGQICVFWMKSNGEIARSRIIDSDGSLMGNESGVDIFPLYTVDNVDDIILSSYNDDFYLTWLASTPSENYQAVYSKKTSNNNVWGEAHLVSEKIGSPFSIEQVTHNYCFINKGGEFYHVFVIDDDGTVSEINQDVLSRGKVTNIILDDNNNLFFTSKEYVDWINSTVIYVQGITELGEPVWESPIQVSSLEESIYHYGRYPRIFITDCIYIIWDHYMGHWSQSELRAQKIPYTGEKLWGENGVSLTSWSEDGISLWGGGEFSANLLDINNENILLDFRVIYDTNHSAMLNIINNDGVRIFEENNYDLFGISKISSDMTYKLLADNLLLSTWSSNTSIYAQIYDMNTIVANESNEIAPTTINLLQNYPNPFNPETNISFLVQNSGQVHLDIYNIKGQKVKTLVNDRFNAGRHGVVWNGKDDSNKQVASGLYLYKMRSGKYSSTKKMILMK